MTEKSGVGYVKVFLDTGLTMKLEASSILRVKSVRKSKDGNFFMAAASRDPNSILGYE